MELTTVHECLKAAQLESKQYEPKTETITIRIEPTVKARASAICERNGTSISDYLRKCCEGLAADYQSPEQTKR